MPATYKNGDVFMELRNQCDASLELQATSTTSTTLGLIERNPKSISCLLEELQNISMHAWQGNTKGDPQSGLTPSIVTVNPPPVSHTPVGLIMHWASYLVASSTCFFPSSLVASFNSNNQQLHTTSNNRPSLLQARELLSLGRSSHQNMRT